MPFMDDAMLDLFGEEAVGGSLAGLQPQVLETGALIRRVDALQHSGCCQQLAWSKAGAITRLSNDGRRILFRAVTRHPQTGQWALTDESPSTITAPEDIFFRHIQWGSLAVELLAVDQYGHLHIWTLACAMDRVSDHVILGGGPVDETSSVVGLHSLPVFPQQSQPPYISIGEREGDEWLNKMTTSRIDTPHHISDGRSSFISITAAHTLKITYQSDPETWSETAKALTDPSTAYDMLTHASFADASQCIYLVTYSTSCTLRLYKVTIDWTQTVLDPSNPASLVVQASLDAELIYIQDDCSPRPTTDDISVPSRQGLLKSRLSQLLILSSNNEVTTQVPDLHIYTVFTYINDNSMQQQSESNVSCMSRLDITQAQPEMLEVFKVLRTNAGNKPSPPDAVAALSKVENVTASKVILSISPVSSDRLLAITYADGSVDFRQLDTFQLVLPDNDDTKAGSLAQAGFAFMPSEKCSDIALSPDACMAVCVNGSDKLALNTMVSPITSTLDISNKQVQAALNTIARDVASLTSLQISADEVFALLPASSDLETRQYLLKQVYRILQRPVDILSDDFRRHTQKLVKDSIMARLFGLQIFMGYDTIPSKLNIPGKVGLISLNFKLISMNLVQTITPKEPLSAEAVIALRHPIRWTFDILSMIADDLLTLQRTLPSPFQLSNLVARLRASNSASLHLLLLSTPRAMIRMTLELLKMYFGRTVQATIGPTTAAQRLQCQEIAAYAKNLPVRTQAFEALLTEIDAAIRSALTATKITAAQRIDAELRLLVDGDVPEVLDKVAEFVLTKVTAKLADAVETGRIMFLDVDWLGLREQPEATTLSSSPNGGGRWRRGEGRGQRATDLAAVRKGFDAVRKTKLLPGTKLRSCRRCGSVMEDLLVQLDWEKRRKLAPWIASASRNCVCLGHWMVGDVE